MNNKMAINIYLSTITSNANVLNVPIKWPMEAEWITNEDTYKYCLQETHFTHRLKVKG